MCADLLSRKVSPGSGLAQGVAGRQLLEGRLAMGRMSQSDKNRISDAGRFFIYQVELSSYCNMQCPYCPHPGMRREKGFMSEEVLDACIDRVRSQRGTRIVLHHFGEPLLHPQLQQRLQQVASSGLSMQLSTNSLLLDRCWDTLISIPAEIIVMISVHRWTNKIEQDYFDAVSLWADRSRGTNVKIVYAYNLKNNKFTFHNWAHGSSQPWDSSLCPFVKDNLAVVLWNGDIASCCVDHEGVTAGRNILNQDCDLHVSKVWEACETCDVGRIMVGEKCRP
jgi:organic radical activating enzyme